MKLRLVRDSTGSPSWTCTLAIPAAIALTGRVLIGGFSIKFAHWEMAVTAADSTVVLALVSFLGFFAQRDWRIGLQQAPPPVPPTIPAPVIVAPVVQTPPSP